MNKKFLSTLLLASAFVAAAGLIALADTNKKDSGATQQEQMPAAIQESIRDGIENDRLESDAPSANIKKQKSPKSAHGKDFLAYGWCAA